MNQDKALRVVYKITVQDDGLPDIALYLPGLDAKERTTAEKLLDPEVSGLAATLAAHREILSLVTGRIERAEIGGESVPVEDVIQSSRFSHAVAGRVLYSLLFRCAGRVQVAGNE